MTVTIYSVDSNTAVLFSPDFTAPVLNAVRSVPGRQWNNEKKIWVLPNSKKSVEILLHNLYKTGLFNSDEEINIPHQNASEINRVHEIKKMVDLLKVRHYSKHTIDCYRKWLENFLCKNPVLKDSSGHKEINAYLKNLAVKKNVSASTQNQALAALLFYFRFVKNVSVEQLEPVIHAKKKVRIPVVFSREEVHRVIENLSGTKKLIAKLLYGTGLRLNEALSLRVLDIDFDRNEIIVRHGKGDKDRHVMLPQKLVPELKAHIESVQKIHEKDLQDGWGAVSLPGALNQKYAGGSREFKWQFVYNL